MTELIFLIFIPMSMDEMFSKFFESMQDATKGREKSFESSSSARKKTKKEMLKEEKAYELEKLKSKNINSIYKRLAKELHPDLEQDPALRAEKEGVMKRLTKGYENSDLLEILKIESEWFSRLEQDIEAINEETVKIYNSILKDQIKELEKEISIICLHPRYMDIFKYTENYPTTPLKGLQNILYNLRSIEEEYLKRIDDLHNKDAVKIIKRILAECRVQSELEDLLNSFDKY